MTRNSREEVLARITRLRISAILRTDDQTVAAEAMRAAVGGGFRMIEFTMTTPGALQLIAEFSADDDLLVGAGTVMSPEQAGQAVEAGAAFLVSPVCDPEVIAAARAMGVVSIPGTHTPTEMQRAHGCGADMVKLFPAPADVAGYVSTVLGPMPYLRIFPTSGVTVDNFVDILRAGAVGVGFVKALFRPSWMAERDHDAIQRCAARILELGNAL